MSDADLIFLFSPSMIMVDGVGVRSVVDDFFFVEMITGDDFLVLLDMAGSRDQSRQKSINNARVL